jgi:hypothetical protein
MDRARCPLHPAFGQGGRGVAIFLIAEIGSCH